MKRRMVLAALTALVTMSATAQWQYEWQNPTLQTTQRVENLLGMQVKDMDAIIIIGGITAHHQERKTCSRWTLR